ncbi:unnamed protein product [Periconia digitata]|uniref:NADP-dependent oxidoreductase domain-containing protein n=1 Tax=Periconia digitata TaxID=1303443 RepID=A0A9W4U2H4_9PLEO|nr:unnamed protein product [Periconia digitata]
MVQILNQEVGNPGFGLMSLTKPGGPTTEQAIEVMRTALQNGAKFWNGGEFYGTPDYNSLHLVNKYFTKYPEDADKVVLSIKGAYVFQEIRPDNSEANITRSIEEALKVLDGKKSLDIFECARPDPKVPLEETIGTIAKYIKAGKVGGIGLSEVSGETIRRAHAIHPIAAVELEFSLFTTTLIGSSAAKACTELDIPIIAYSPLGRGFLSGQFKSVKDIPEGSFLAHMPRYHPDVFDENLKLVHEVEKIATNKGVTVGQAALGWVLALSGKNGMPQLLALPGTTTTSRVIENQHPATLDDNDLAAIADILKKFEIKGARYMPGVAGEEP